MRGSWGQDYFSDEFRGRLPPVSNNAQHLLLYVFNVMENAHYIRGNTVSVTWTEKRIPCPRPTKCVFYGNSLTSGAFRISCF